MSIVLDGTAGITFPVTAGSASAVQASSGRVLQVVNATNATTSSTSTNTYVTTNLSASITPSNSANKIFVMVSHGGIGKTTSNTSVAVQLLRGSTSIFSTVTGNTGSTGGNYPGNLSFWYLDTPSTTSSTTYSTQFASDANNAIVYVNNTFFIVNPISTITLMEIAA
jgi:hypothetical protein